MDPPPDQYVDASVTTVLLNSDTAHGRLYTVACKDDTVVELPASRVPNLVLTQYYHRRGICTAKRPGRSTICTICPSNKLPDKAATMWSATTLTRAGMAAPPLTWCPPGRAEGAQRALAERGMSVRNYGLHHNTPHPAMPCSMKGRPFPRALPTTGTSAPPTELSLQAMHGT